LYFVADVRHDLHTAKIEVHVEAEGAEEEVVEIVLDKPGGGKYDSVKAKVKDGKAKGSFVVKKPELWWPHGYGEQPLYTLAATLGDKVDTRKKRLGLRRARLVERPLKEQEGLSFFFEINNTPLWVGGSNWIPADSFLTTVDEERYRRWLALARDGNQIMIRWVFF
jgi:beta-mannosidase